MLRRRGLTRGLCRAGREVAADTDVDPVDGEIYRKNNPGTRFVATDLRSLDDEDIRCRAGPHPLRFPRALPPCDRPQPLSHPIASASRKTLLLPLTRR